MRKQNKLSARILSLALSTAMVFTSLSATVFAAEGAAPLDASDTLTAECTITAFDELGEGFLKSDPFDGYTYVRSVELNTPFEELGLPTKLGVTVERTTTATEPVVTEPATIEPAATEPVAEPAATEPVAEPAATEPVATEPAAEPKAATEAPAATEPTVETAPEQLSSVTTVTEDKVPVTWTGDSEYTPAENSNVVYTAVLPEGYALADGAKLPQINVMVGKQAMAAIAAMPRAVVKRTEPLDLTGAVTPAPDQGWEWNAGTKTLTLSGANIDCSGLPVSATNTFAVKLPDGATIELAAGSTSTVKSGNVDGEDPHEGIDTYGIETVGNLTINGSGTLNATGGDATASKSKNSSGGIWSTAEAESTITINGGTINATGGNVTADIATSAGIYTGGTVAITDGAYITAEGKALTGTNSQLSAGVSAQALTMTGGVLNGIAGDAGKSAYSYSQGVNPWNSMTLSGTAIVTGIGKTNAIESNPIIAAGASVTGAAEDFVSGTTTILTQTDPTKPVEISFTKSVTFDTRNGAAAEKVNIDKDTGKIAALPAVPKWGDNAAKDNYTFAGWWTEIDGKGTEFKNENLTASTTVYAKWTKNGKAVRTEPLDLSTATASIDKLSTEGWKFDFDAKTLTLDGATIDCSGNASAAGQISGICLLNNHNIVLADGTTNTVKAGTSSDSMGIGVYFTGGDSASTSISGKGTLYAIGGVAESDSGSVGILCEDPATLTFRDATVIASSLTETESNTGIGIFGNLDVKSGTIKATGTGTSAGFGIQTFGMTMSGGTVTATGTATGTVGVVGEYGIWGFGKIEMTGGTVTATGKTCAIKSDDEEDTTTTDTIIANKATIINGTADNGSFVSGTTKTLTQTDTTKPVVISFTKAVTFDTRGGSAVPSAEINEGGTITMPAAPTWGDYTFAGWYTDKDGKGTAFANSGLTASTTVYAKWTKNGKAVRTEPLDLSTATASIDKLSTEGWKFDFDAKTLTLNGITLNSSKLDNSDARGIKFPNVPCTIILADGTENTVDISSAKNSVQSQVIYSDNKLTIKTSGKGTPGKLNAIAANATDPSGAGAADPSIGIYAGGGLVVESGNITATAGNSANDNSIGISANTSNIHIKGGTVNATGGTSGGTGMEGSFGLYGNNVQIDDGTVTAKGGEATLSAGIVGAAKVTLNGGTINAIGKLAAVAALAANGVVIDDITNVKVNDKQAKVGGTTIGGLTISTLVDDKNAITADAAIKFKPSYTGINPLAPDADKVTKRHDSITLPTPTPTITGEAIEYGIEQSGTIAWQDEPTFGSLTPNTPYNFYNRVKANDTHKAGTTSDATTIKTKKLPANVSGTVKDSNNSPLVGATVILKQGNTEVANTTTIAGGSYTMENVPEGVYNLVITKGTGETKITITETVIVQGTPVNVPEIAFLDGNKNTVVESSDGTPEVAVGGMNALLNTNLTTLTDTEKNKVAGGGSVELKFTANLKTPDDVGGDKSAIEGIAGGQKIDMLLDLSVWKTVKDSTGNTVTNDELIPSLAGIITVHLPIPAHLQGKAGLQLYRMHNGKAEKLKEGSGNAVDGEYYTIDGTFMTLYLKKFSIYAIGCNAFDVTIADGGTGASSNGKYSNGEVVTINAGSRSGYSFDGWTVTPGTVTLANPSDATTTFVMPSAAVTVTAGWTYTGGGSSGGAGGGSSGGNGEYEFWMQGRDRIDSAKNGDVIKLNLQSNDKMPASVMDALRKNPRVSLVISWNGGKTITIPAGKAAKQEDGRIYYPLSLLAELYAGYTEDSVLKSTAPQNPQTGGPGKLIPAAGGELITLEAPAPAITENAQANTVTPPDAGFEADAFVGTPDERAARGTSPIAVAAVVLLLAAIGGGWVLLWKRDNKEQE